MSTSTTTTPTPTDRQASRAINWAVSMIQDVPGAWWGGMLDVQARTREDAWSVAYAMCAEKNGRGQGPDVAPSAVALAGLTRTELVTVREFLSGRAVRLQADRATGLESVEHRAGRVYVHQLMEPRELVDLDPETMARAGDSLDRYRKVGAGHVIPTTGRISKGFGEAYATRCAAVDVPEAFKPTGRVAVWAWWPEDTSPTFPDTPEGRADAARLARLHSGGRASLVLDGVTIATMHSAHSAAHSGDGWPGPYGPVLRVLHPNTVDQLGPRAARIMRALRSIAGMGHPDNLPDVETCWTPAELVAAQLDPRDGPRVPVLKPEPPSILEVAVSEGRAAEYDHLDDRQRGHLHATPMRAPWENVRRRLEWEPGELWKLAAESPAYFDLPDVPTDARKVNR